MYLSFIHVVYVSISFLLMVEYHPIICIPLFLHLSVSGHKGCLHILAIINDATMSIHVHVFGEHMLLNLISWVYT